MVLGRGGKGLGGDAWALVWVRLALGMGEWYQAGVGRRVRWNGGEGGGAMGTGDLGVGVGGPGSWR